MLVSIRHFVIPFLTSVTVDSKDDHTVCLCPIFSESMFKYESVDLSLASCCKCSDQYLFTAVFTYLFQRSSMKSCFSDLVYEVTDINPECLVLC